MHIRHADPERDAAACAAIYAPSVIETAASFEERAPSPAEMAQRIATTSAHWPWLVAERDGVIAGYAYAGRHRARAAYRWSVDVTVYVDRAHQRRGVGRALYRPLLTLLATQGFCQACAGIALPNPGSVALHESLGFVPVGVFRATGFKHGRWWDVGWWQKPLRDGPAAAAPVRIGPPPRLDD